MQIYTHEAIDVTASPKDGDATFEHLKEHIELLEKHHKVAVLAVVSDAGGEAAKARRLIRQWRPDIIVLDCMSHQFNLSVGGELCTLQLCMHIPVCLLLLLEQPPIFLRGSQLQFRL